MAGWYVAPCLEQLRAELNTRWPARDRASDGGVGDVSHAARASDHNPAWADGGVVRARDFDEDGIPTDLLLREAITDPRTNYVIYERLLYPRFRGFKPVEYTGINPHDHHMHISIRHGAQWENDRTPWFTDAVLTSHSTPVKGIDIPDLAPTSLTTVLEEIVQIDRRVIISQQDGTVYFVDLHHYVTEQFTDMDYLSVTASSHGIEEKDYLTWNNREIQLLLEWVDGHRKRINA